MFVGQPLPNGHPGISRPFVVAVILLLLFLSMQTDWSPPRGGANKPRTDNRNLQAVPADNATREATKEKVSIQRLYFAVQEQSWLSRTHASHIHNAPPVGNVAERACAMPATAIGQWPLLGAICAGMIVHASVCTLVLARSHHLVSLSGPRCPCGRALQSLTYCDAGMQIIFELTVSNERLEARRP